MDVHVTHMALLYWEDSLSEYFTTHQIFNSISDFFSFLLGGYIVFLLDNLKGDRNHLSSCGIPERKNLEHFHYKHVTLVSTKLKHNKQQ